MSAPFIDASPALLAIPVGVAFGATLERAGLGSARTIAGQLAGRDFTVIKVMFSAIVTAMLGVFWAGRLGWLDLSRVAIPDTDILPQLVGAILFGAGFAIASLCPGTACVSAATGKRDGLMTIAGLFLGTMVVSLLWSQLGAVAVFSPAGPVTLPATLGISPGMVVAAITMMGLLTVALSNRIVGGAGPPGPWRLSPLAAGAVAFGALAAVSSPTSAVPGRIEVVNPRDLASWIRAHRSHLRILDVRDSVAPDDYRIPGAEAANAHRLPSLTVAASDTLVVYADHPGESDGAIAKLLGSGAAAVMQLRGGLDGWSADVMSPRAPDPLDSAAVARFPAVRELSAWFGGRVSRDPAPIAPEPHLRRKRGC